jgi:6-phospho-beta-glucosidase
MKISVIGCGLRTPLLLSALLRTGRLPKEVVLFDIDRAQADLMLRLGHASVPNTPVHLRVARRAEEAIEGSDFVICAIRPGGIKARARDERVCLDMGFVGQETVGPAGCAMAWRTIPAVLQYVRLIETLAPNAWLINFTNPAGVVTQAIHEVSRIKMVGICDTPAELFFRIALCFEAEIDDVHCEYVGLNHIGFVTKVTIGETDVTAQLLEDDTKLLSLYPVPLYPHELIRHIGSIPSEYCFFYLRPGLALNNQRLAGKTRGEELVEVNRSFYQNLTQAALTDGIAAGLQVYSSYLNQRNASYMKLEAEAGSALQLDIPEWNAFEAETGYHRIAVQTIQGLCGQTPSELVLNIANQGAVAELLEDDVVESKCAIDAGGVHRIAPVEIPRSVKGLIENTKAFERSFVKAALERSEEQFAWSLTQHPLVRDWDAAEALVKALLHA